MAMKAQVPRVIELADRIADDIKRRKLRPGDPYLSTLEAAGLLGVSTTAANRAMQMLVKRRLLERRQKKGTFIAQPSATVDDAPLRRVHLLVQENYLRTEGLLADGTVIGMHGQLPSAQMQFNFLPADDQATFVERVIAEAMRSRQTEGFVLVRASLDTQRAIALSGLPAAVIGTLHPSVPHIPWVDRDHRQAGRLLVDHLLGAKVKRFIVLMRDRMFQGDHILLDSIGERLAQSKLALSSLTLRCLPADNQAIAAAVEELLARNGERAGIICRSEPLALGASTAARNLRLREDEDLRIVLTDVYRKGSEPPPVWPHLKMVLTPEQVGEHIGRMLAQQARREAVEPPHEIVPVDLVESR
jgi:DNA-binding LacI/PurR family transcriptional regulator/DNA-binding transcriptional regulator YhcF (GntR family)